MVQGVLMHVHVFVCERLVCAACSSGHALRVVLMRSGSLLRPALAPPLPVQNCALRIQRLT